jgi:hypothetical protein
MSSRMETRRRRRVLVLMLAAAVVGLVVVEPFPKGKVLFSLTSTHGVDAGDLSRVRPAADRSRSSHQALAPAEFNDGWGQDFLMRHFHRSPIRDLIPRSYPTRVQRSSSL